jgi:hypothetical protein
MITSKKLTSEWALRLSLGVMYLYSGVDIVRHPSSWTWAIRSLPTWIYGPITIFGVENFLYLQGIVEILFGVVLLGWFVSKAIVKYVGLVSALEMAAIVILVGIDAVTFRDIGLIGAGLALFLL